MKQVDLNCDLGESFGAYTIGQDEKVLPLISSANIACGFHGGDPLIMERTVALAKEAGVSIGAHPGFPDLIGFGRRNLAVSPKEARAYVQYQVGALKAFCDAKKVPLSHVKPHGALYNMAGKDPRLASALCEGLALSAPDCILLALAGSEMIKAAKDCGLFVAQEVFADRAYEEDGSLVPRTKPGAMITEEQQAIRQVLTMVLEGKAVTVTGKEIPLQADSICVHGDGEKALLFVKKIRTALEQAGIEIRPFFKQRNRTVEKSNRK